MNTEVKILRKKNSDTYRNWTLVSNVRAGPFKIPNPFYIRVPPDGPFKDGEKFRVTGWKAHTDGTLRPGCAAGEETEFTAKTEWF